jgi:hypothetical protein
MSQGASAKSPVRRPWRHWISGATPGDCVLQDCIESYACACFEMASAWPAAFLPARSSVSQSGPNIINKKQLTRANGGIATEVRRPTAVSRRHSTPRYSTGDQAFAGSLFTSRHGSWSRPHCGDNGVAD